MFDAIAARYDRLNRILSFGLDQRWRRRLVDALGDRPREVLDLATGTGDVAIAIARRHAAAHVIGLDPSREMLRHAERKRDRLQLGPRIQLIAGDAQELPFESDRFDACSIAFGIRNFPDRDRALREMKRVLRSGGRAAILELGEPSAPVLGSLARWHVHSVVPRLGAWLSGAREYRYLEESIAAFPPATQFAAQMNAAGLTVVAVQKIMLGAATLFVSKAD